MRYPLLALLSACSTDLLAPIPGTDPHFTAVVDGRPFVGYVAADACIGTQITPTMFFLNVQAAGAPSGSGISIHLGGVTGTGRVTMRPNEVQAAQRAALYVPDDPTQLQYSTLTGSGDILIDEYDPVARRVAGRFFFRAYRAVGTAGPEWVEIRQGSFRGILRAWGSQDCS